MLSYRLGTVKYYLANKYIKLYKYVFPLNGCARLCLTFISMLFELMNKTNKLLFLMFYMYIN